MVNECWSYAAMMADEEEEGGAEGGVTRAHCSYHINQLLLKLHMLDPRRVIDTYIQLASC